MNGGAHNLPGVTRRAVLLTKAEARRLQELMTMHVDYPELEPEDKDLYDRLEAVR
jgi:hypothetical protein